MCVTIILTLGLILLIADYHLSKKEIPSGIERNSYGKGSKIEELSVKVDGQKEQILEIEVSEQTYKEEEILDFFERCKQKLKKQMLGSNESLDCVTHDLQLINSIPGEPVDISWELDCYDVMNIYGELEEKEINEQGEIVHLSAILTYTENTEYQSRFECAANICQREKSTEEIRMDNIQEQIKLNNEKTRTEETLKLPKIVDGEKVNYYRKMNTRGVVLIIMAIIIGILFYAQTFQEKNQMLQIRKKQMMLDYPEIVNKLTLFLGAGMTLKRAWEKIVMDYEEKKSLMGVRDAYEEMKISCKEMESGIREAESYERFGQRCGIQEYTRLGALLSQNVRKGTKGLSQMLRLEAIQAFENRKAEAKKYGEEAGTKLLVPMFIMLIVVFIIVVVPAFLTLQV